MELLRPLIDGLYDLEQDVHPDLSVDRWRRSDLPDLPAIWNWVPSPSELELTDQAQHRDTFNVSAYIGVRHSDSDEEMGAIELYADAFMAAVDPALHSRPPLGVAVYFKQLPAQVRGVFDAYRVASDRFSLA